MATTSITIGNIKYKYNILIRKHKTVVVVVVIS